MIHSSLSGLGTTARAAAIAGSAYGAVTGVNDVVTGSVQGMGLASTSIGVAADTAAVMENGIESAKHSSVAGSLASKAGKLGSIAKGIARTAGPLGLAAGTANGLDQALNGKTALDRMAGVATTTAGVTSGMAAAPALGGLKAASRAMPAGGAVTAGIEGLTQLSKAQTTQDYVAGSLKTASATAFAAAAIPGPHTPVAALVGTGTYAGALVADNWDESKALAGAAADAVYSGAAWAGSTAMDVTDVVADTLSSGAAWAGDTVTDTVGGLVSGIGSWFD